MYDLRTVTLGEPAGRRQGHYYGANTLTADEIAPHLRSRAFGREIYAFDSLESTNLAARSLAGQGAGHGALVIAEEQTSGRGRQGRTWIAEKGKNLTFSVILRPRSRSASAGIIPLYAGLSVAEAIRPMIHRPPVCKWPNDILFGDKKVCGILSESCLSPGEIAHVIVGIGINVNQTNFPPEIAGKATSLASVSGGPLGRIEVLASILRSLELWYEKVEAGDSPAILKSWMEYATMFGKPVRVNQEGRMIEGIALGLADDGGLLIQSDEKEIKILTGEIAHTV